MSLEARVGTPEASVPVGVSQVTTTRANRQVVGLALAKLPEEVPADFLLYLSGMARFRDAPNGNSGTECSAMYPGAGEFKCIASDIGPEAAAQALVEVAIQIYLHGDYQGMHGV